MYDFRSMPDGPRGYKVGITKKGHLGSKRKLEAYAEQVRVFCASACPLCPLCPGIRRAWPRRSSSLRPCCLYVRACVLSAVLGGFPPRRFQIRVGRLTGPRPATPTPTPQVELEAATMDTDHIEVDPSASLKKRQATKHNNVGQGRVSGRTWKAPGEKASTIRAGSSKKISTSWERKMKEKAMLKDMRDRKREALEARKAAGKAAREQKEEAKKRKEENRKRSGLVTQVVSAATARRMAKSKKGRKKLVAV